MPPTAARARASTKNINKIFFFIVFTSPGNTVNLRGGAYFGRVGCFDEGYEFDAIVMDDSAIKSGMTLADEARVERLIYQSGRCVLRAKFCAGREIDLA